MATTGFPIALIEDSEDDELLALRALEELGLRGSVVLSHDGAEGLRDLGLQPPAHDRPIPCLIISDYKMPRIDGIELLRKVRTDVRLRDVPFLIFSSSDEPADIERCLRAGATAYVVKPIDTRKYVTELKAAIVQVLGPSGILG